MGHGIGNEEKYLLDAIRSLIDWIDISPNIKTCPDCGVTVDANIYSCNCTEGQ